MIQWFCALFVLLTVIGAQSQETKKVVCYYGSWAGYRQGKGKFEPESMDPTLCTHLIYTFVGITEEGGVRILDSWNDLPDGKDFFRRFQKLKEGNPEVKILIAIGGWNEGSQKYSTVMNNPSKRAAFVQNVVTFVKQYNFDGFDLDWEYPGQRGGAATDMEAFVALTKELRAEFDKHGLLLSAAVGAGNHLVGTAYNIPEINKYLHFINIMTYDLHGSWDPVTGHNSPLYPSSMDKDDLARMLNVNFSIQNWIQHGASPEKVVVGMGTYGRTFTLQDSGNNGIGAPTYGGGERGPYTGETGFMGYNEICEMQMNGGWNVVWDDEQKVPYASKGTLWAGYDSPESIALKAQYVKSMNLGGAMIWSIETDDFLGLCHGEKFPLLRAINKALNGGTGGGNGGGGSNTKPPSLGDTSTTTTTKAPTTTKTPTTTKATVPDPTGLCKKEGYVQDPLNCEVFYYCQIVNGAYLASRFQCATGLAFDPAIEGCNYKNEQNCPNA